MAFVKVTKTGNSIEVDFGVYGTHPNTGSKARSYDCRDIVELDLVYSESHVQMMMRALHGKNNWSLTFDQTYSGEEYFIVEDIDGTPPTSNQDLFSRLQALR